MTFEDRRMILAANTTESNWVDTIRERMANEFGLAKK